MVFVQPLGDLLGIIEEDALASSFNKFYTKKDLDVSNFLKHLAIDYEKKDIARTFLIFSDDFKGKVLAYFTIGLNVLHVNRQLEVQEAYEGVNLYENGYQPIYKLFMIGKDDNCPVALSIKHDVFEKEIVGLLKKVKKNVGTNLMYLDCVKDLLSYYKSLGFETFDYNRKSNLYYMVKAI
jgi:hypothetical protein